MEPDKEWVEEPDRVRVRDKVTESDRVEATDMVEDTDEEVSGWTRRS